jgi:hypothetical protein
MPWAVLLPPFRRQLARFRDACKVQAFRRFRSDFVNRPGEIVNRVAKAVTAEHEGKLDYMVGARIEIQRCSDSGRGQTGHFFSFGTNDLTQTCLGVSRDGSGSFIPSYQEAEIIKTNLFASRMCRARQNSAIFSRSTLIGRSGMLRCLSSRIWVLRAVPIPSLIPVG